MDAGTSLVTLTPGGGLTLGIDLDRAREYASASKAANTRRAYASDWSDFVAWCRQHDLAPLPAQPRTIGVYLASRAEVFRVATLRRRLVSIAVAHRAAGYPSPTGDEPVSSVMAGIARTKGAAPKGRAPVLVEDLRSMLATLGDDLLGLRDRAILLLGFALGARRSELVGLDVADLTHSSQGVSVRIARSKMDQEGLGRKIGVPFGRSPETCPVRALRCWLEASGITEGPLFRAVDKAGRVSPRRLTAQVVRLIVRRRAKAAGLDVTNIGAHSLRSGLVTSAVIGGASELAIMRQTGHASVAMVRRYTRDADLFRGNVVHALGL